VFTEWCFWTDFGRIDVELQASQDLFAQLDPSTMHGNLLMIGCTGVAGYLVADRPCRTVYYS
jgi:hypothetical protein